MLRYWYSAQSSACNRTPVGMLVLMTRQIQYTSERMIHLKSGNNC
jgi:hypothetical protein